MLLLLLFWLSMTWKGQSACNLQWSLVPMRYQCAQKVKVKKHQRSFWLTVRCVITTIQILTPPWLIYGGKWFEPRSISCLSCVIVRVVWPFDCLLWAVVILTLKMTTAQAVETSVTTSNSLSEDNSHPNDLTQDWGPIHTNAFSKVCVFISLNWTQWKYCVHTIVVRSFYRSTQSRTQSLLASYCSCSTKTKGSGKDWF